MSKTTIAKKVASLFGANLDDAVTKTGAKSKGKMTRADGSTYSLMGDDLLRIQDNISQYKGAGKTLAVLSPLALVAFADKKSEPLKVIFLLFFLKSSNTLLCWFLLTKISNKI